MNSMFIFSSLGMGIITAIAAKVGKAIGASDHRLAYRYAIVAI
jgi:Na+-driven multidrug efflux pump